MGGLVLIPWARTDWSDRGRLAARIALPLNEAGVAQADGWARQIGARKLQCVFTSLEQTARETGERIAKATRTRTKTLSGIEEVSFGLWEGLTEATLKTRFPKVYKRWKEDPTAVTPPDGEPLVEAAERIAEALRRATRKAKDGMNGMIGVVMGPVACAVARCTLEKVAIARVRDMLLSGPVFYDPLPEPGEARAGATAKQDDQDAAR